MTYTYTLFKPINPSGIPSRRGIRYRAAVVVAPATEEKGETMHKSFSSLLDSLLYVFEKYGYTEYSAGE
jgi:hypothetical protein